LIIEIKIENYLESALVGIGNKKSKKKNNLEK
jgi:hypothetical protein